MAINTKPKRLRDTKLYRYLAQGLSRNERAKMGKELQKVIDKVGMYHHPTNERGMVLDSDLYAAFHWIDAPQGCDFWCEQQDRVKRYLEK